MIYDDSILFDPFIMGEKKLIQIEEFYFLNQLCWFLSYNSSKQAFSHQLPKYDESGIKQRAINACLSYLEFYYQYEYLITEYKGTYHGFTYSQFADLNLDEIASRQNEIIENLILEFTDDVKTISLSDTENLPLALHKYYSFAEIKKIEKSDINPANLLKILEADKLKKKAPHIFSSILRLLLNPKLNSEFILLFHNFNHESYSKFFSNSDLDYIDYFQPGDDLLEKVRIMEFESAHSKMKTLSSAIIKLDLINDMIYQFKTDNVYSPFTKVENTSDAVRKYGPTIKEQYLVHDQYHLARLIHCFCIIDISITSEVNIERHNFDTILRLTHRFAEYF